MIGFRRRRSRILATAAIFLAFALFNLRGWGSPLAMFGGMLAVSLLVLATLSEP